MKNYRKKLYLFKTPSKEYLFSSYEALTTFLTKNPCLKDDKNHAFVEYFEPTIKIEINY